eukprot:scaffold693_cov200-Alexandrium_tamarense.AAC.57
MWRGWWEGRRPHDMMMTRDERQREREREAKMELSLQRPMVARYDVCVWLWTLCRGERRIGGGKQWLVLFGCFGCFDLGSLCPLSEANIFLLYELSL